MAGWTPSTMVVIGTVNAGMLVMKSYDDSTEDSFALIPIHVHSLQDSLFPRRPPDNLPPPLRSQLRDAGIALSAHANVNDRKSGREWAEYFRVVLSKTFTHQFHISFADQLLHIRSMHTMFTRRCTDCLYTDYASALHNCSARAQYKCSVRAQYKCSEEVFFSQARPPTCRSSTCERSHVGGLIIMEPIISLQK